MDSLSSTEPAAPDVDTGPCTRRFSVRGTAVAVCDLARRMWSVCSASRARYARHLGQAGAATSTLIAEAVGRVSVCRSPAASNRAANSDSVRSRPPCMASITMSMAFAG